MTDSLREQIAERLNQIWCAWEWDGGRETPCPTLASGEWGDGYVNNCLAVASEVIRIAEWAADQRAEDVFNRCGATGKIMAWAARAAYAPETVAAAIPEIAAHYREVDAVRVSGSLNNRPLTLPPDDWKPSR